MFVYVRANICRPTLNAAPTYTVLKKTYDYVLNDKLNKNCLFTTIFGKPRV